MTEVGSMALEGRFLGGYQVVGRLGHGAMADVYDAVDSTGHEVALKVFKAGGGMSYTMLERFRREAEATKILRRHPYILTVYASGHEGDYHYIAMEKVKDSRSLDSYMHRRPPRPELIQIGLKLAEALQYAHDHQIIHRDVKPSNVLLNERNEPLLTDFGVAELTDWPSLTLSGALTGTPMYMAPEQARSEEASPASDVYSLGVVMYEAFTGELPYQLDDTASTTSILDAVKHQPARPPRTLDRTISKDLSYVLLKALRKNPAERYASAREFAGDLQAVFDGKGVAGRWTNPWARTGFWLRQHRTAVAGGLSLALAAFAGSVVLREQLREQAYQELILKAREVSKDYQLAWFTNSRGEIEMKAAQRAMRRGRWVEARDMLQTAEDIYERLEQTLPLATARLELSRVEVMLHNSLRARELYRDIWEDPDLPEPLREVAGFEAALLRGLDLAPDQIPPILTAIGNGANGEFVLLTEHLTGGADPGTVDDLLTSSSPRMQRYAVLADVVRQHAQGKRDGLAQRLEALKDLGGSGADPYDWPLPFADYIRGRL